MEKAIYEKWSGFIHLERPMDSLSQPDTRIFAKKITNSKEISCGVSLKVMSGNKIIKYK